MNLSPLQLEALTELINIGGVKAVELLNEMIKSHVRLQLPVVRVLTATEAAREFSGFSQEKVSLIRLGFTGRLDGSATLYFPSQSAAKLVNILIGERPENQDLDFLKIGTLTEVGNILLNGVVGSLANSIGQHVKFSVPAYEEETVTGLVNSSIPDSEHVVVIAEIEFSVEQLQIKGHILFFLEIGSFKGLVGVIDEILRRKAEEGS